MVRVCSILLSGLLCNMARAAEAAHDATEPSLFSGTFADSLWTVIAFVMLMLALGKLAWRPLLETLTARETLIENQIKTAQAAREQAETLLSDYEQQGSDLLKKAADQAHREQQRMVQQTQQEIKALRKQAMEDIDNARQAAQEQLWHQAGDMVLTLGSQVLGHSVTDSDNRRLIDEAIAKIKEGE